jgi:hypothetical protein
MSSFFEMPEGFKAYFLRRKQENSEITALLVDETTNGMPRDLVSYSSDDQPVITSTGNPPDSPNQIQISYPRGRYQSVYLHDNHEPCPSVFFTKLFWTASYNGGIMLLFDWSNSEWILMDYHTIEYWRGKVLDQRALEILETWTEPACFVDMPLILEYLNHLYSSA